MKEKYSKEELESIIEEVFENTELHRDREFKLYIFGTIEQVRNTLIEFDKAMKEEVKKYFKDE